MLVAQHGLPLDLYYQSSIMMPRTIQQSLSSLAAASKRPRKPQTVRIAPEVQEFDPVLRPGRRARKNLKSTLDDNDDMHDLTARGTRGTPSDTARRSRSSATPSAPSNHPSRLTRTGRISKARKGQPVHHCDSCTKTYTRAEHLRRHQLNHKSPTLTCPMHGCGKQFHREDLLNRHMEEHASSSQEPSRPLGNELTRAETMPISSTLHTPLLFQSPSRTPTYPDPSLSHRIMDPPAPMPRGRTYPTPTIPHNPFTSPISYGHPTPTNSVSLDIPQNYTWRSAPASTYRHSPMFDTIQINPPVSAPSYDTLTARTPHVNLSIMTSPYSYDETHTGHQESYSFVTTPQYQEAIYAPPLDPSLMPSGAGQSEVMGQAEYLRFGGPEETEHSYRGVEDTEHHYHGV